MRLFTSALCTAVAVGLLAGCSGSNLGSSLPGGSQTIALAVRPNVHLISGVRPATGCTSQYNECVILMYGGSPQIEFCVTTGSFCGPSLPPYKWSGKITTLSGKTFTSIVASFKPNPGNPVEDKFKEKNRLKGSNGNVKYVQDVTYCPKSDTCAHAYIGIITK